MSTHIRLGMLPQTLVTRHPVYVPTGTGPTIGPSVTYPPTGPQLGPVQTTTVPGAQPPQPVPPTQIVDTGIVPPVPLPPVPVSVFAPPDQGGSSTQPATTVAPAAIVGLSPLGMIAIGALGILAGIAVYNTVKHREAKAA